MRVQLPYGHSQLSAIIPESTPAKTVQSKEWNVSHPQKLVANALRKPLGSPKLSDIARHCRSAVIVTCDKTRGVPSKVTLPLILKELKAGGIKGEVKVLIATGLHRDETINDVRERFGTKLTDELQIIIHNSDDESESVFLGKLPSGTHLYLNRTVVESDLVIIEGTVEPHFFAGFTGGSKVILPGVASSKTVLENHRWQNIDNYQSRYGTLDNPIRADGNSALKFLKKTFALNLVLSSQKRIVHATAGHVTESFNTIAKKVTEHSRILVKKRPDIVITSNGGYPLDRNIYQCVKGIAVPEEITHDGSRIIMVGECADGISHGAFKELLLAGGPSEIYAKLKSGDTVRDQWEAQVLCRILLKNQVWFVTRKELKLEIEGMHMHYASTIEEALNSCNVLKGEQALVAPEGPSLILKAA
jgi:nickel-dependent lactate racemase